MYLSSFAYHSRNISYLRAVCKENSPPISFKGISLPKGISTHLFGRAACVHLGGESAEPQGFIYTVGGWPHVAGRLS